jgi:hypothetical protein
MKYELHTAIREEIESGSIWISTPDFTSRTVVKVKHPETGCAVHCEAKKVDEFYRNDFVKRTGEEIKDSSKSIFVGAWYRKQLGIPHKYGIIDLEVTEADSLFGRMRACLDLMWPEKNGHGSLQEGEPESEQKTIRS